MFFIRPDQSGDSEDGRDAEPVIRNKTHGYRSTKPVAKKPPAEVPSKTGKKSPIEFPPLKKVTKGKLR